MTGKTSTKFSCMVRGRAVRLLLDHEHELTSRCTAITRQRQRRLRLKPVCAADRMNLGII